MWKIEGALAERDGALYWEGVSVKDIAREFGTPTYAYSESRMVENYRRLVDAFSREYAHFRAFYAIKCNNNLSVLRVLQRAGSGADCSSPAEIMLAKLAGFAPNDLLYTGNYNADEEFRYAISSGATINLDDAAYVSRITHLGASGPLCFRVNPGMGSGGFKELVFAGPDAKFGVPADQVLDAYRHAKQAGFTEFGVHMMTGSNIADPAYFAAITERLLDIAGSAAKELGIGFSFINIGGGFGIPYKPGEPDLDISATAKGVVQVFRAKCEEYSLGTPQLRVEPGRYFMGDAGILVSRVHAIKRAAKTFAGCDAGMNTLLRPALYGAYHHIFVDGKVDASKIESGQHKGSLSKYNVCGQICENTDQFAKDRDLPSNLSEGDLLVVLNAGAYGFGMGSQYNSRPRAAEVLCTHGRAEVIRERETAMDLLYRQRVPPHLLSEGSA